MSPTTSARSRPASAPRSRRPGRPSPKTKQDHRQGVLALTREELLGLVDDYRALKRQLGLMDFSDQIALGARLAEERPEVGQAERDEVPGRAARRVPGHVGRPGADAQPAVLRPDPDTVAGTRSPPSATPARRSTAGAAPRSPTSSGSATDFPAADGSTDVATYPLSVNRRSDARILADRQRAGRPALRAVHLGAAAARAAPHAERGHGPGRPCTRPTTTSWPGWPTQVRGRTPAMADPSWREIGVLTRDNAHAADVFDALTRADDPGRDRRSPGAAPAARGGRGRRHPDPAARPDRQRRAAHAADRAAVGDRPA